ncbi:MAG: DUF374 domain-containing protein [Acidobacteria bacterium]|nr:DUF374 domain-containing protein [Acidobacteriota bacterium]
MISSLKRVFTGSSTKCSFSKRIRQAKAQFDETRLGTDSSSARSRHRDPGSPRHASHTPLELSSTRGGQAALREMIRMARSGERLAFTPDGPTGPRRIAKPGVIQAAQLSGLPIVPAAIVAERRRLLDSWDRFQIPRPFSRTLFLYEKPIEVPRNLTPEGFEAKRLELEQVMHELVRKGEEEFSRLWEEAEG